MMLPLFILKVHILYTLKVSCMFTLVGHLKGTATVQVACIWKIYCLLFQFLGRVFLPEYSASNLYQSKAVAHVRHVV